MDDELVTKRKFFSTRKKRETFLTKLEKQDNFYRVMAGCGGA